MARYNVNRDVQDDFYRYKMPAIIAKVEGKGNGVKTVIVNMSDVAKALGRPATYACKFFGCELGAQTQFDLKNDRYIVNGSHDSMRLQDMLDVFIKKFILCQECENPETTMIVKRGSIGLVCKACGNQSLVDLRHKLCTYIINHPPQKEKKEKKVKTKKDQNSSSEDDKSEDRRNGKHLIKTTNNGIDDDDWSVDISPEAIAARMTEITSGAATLTLSNDLERTPSERANMLYAFIKKHISTGTIDSASKEIANEAERLDMKSKAPLILVELLCDQNMKDQLKTYRNHFLRLCHGNQKAQKALLGGFEKMVELHREALLPKVAFIVKEFYDLDIIDEEILIQWGDHASKKYVSKDLSKTIHAKAAPVINWLKEAEEESSEEDEEEIEIEYSHKAGMQLKIEDKPAMPKHAGNGDADQADVDDDDDVDIDDI